MNSLGGSKEQAESKLIILYMLQKAGMPISSPKITKLILECGFMNYFQQQQYINELLEGKFISSESSEDKSKTLYFITEEGVKNLNCLINLIPAGIKTRIDNSIPALKKNIRNESSIVADYIMESENKFIVECAVREDNFPLIELEITVGTRNDARGVCRNWKKHSQFIYTEILESLMKKRD